ncbi:MAG: B12-binding domain-containing radical SAM protein [Candidatus Omnitrophica bacterium]|nr:B12-binding domain-containing radical SAM protein [Candidatus Omnitrophota bacterium]
MKVTLIQPPIQDFYFTPMRSFPLGLCSLASCLKRKGHAVVIFDCIQGGTRGPAVSDDTAFDYLKPFYPKKNLSPFGLFKEFRHYGLSFAKIRDELAKLDAKVFGISSLCSAYADESLRVAHIVKEVHPKSLVVMGGAHAHEYAEYILTHCLAVDFIVLGEGEETFCELVSSLHAPQKVKGIAYRKNSIAIKTEKRSFVQPLRSVPWAQRDLLDLDSYTIKKQRYTPIQTARGCPLCCTFCSIPHFMGKKFRMRDAHDVCSEIIHCYDRLKIRIFDIEDDNFTCDKKRAVQLLSLLIERLETRSIELTAMNGLYYKGLDKNIIALLHIIGMRRINLSLVSSSDATAQKMKRNVEFEIFKEVIQWARECDMHITVYFIVGLPGERIDDMLRTLLYLSTLPVLIGPSIYYHVPGSPLFAQLEKKGVVLRKDYRFFRSSALFYENEMFNRCDIATVFRLTRIINFIKALLLKTDNSSDIHMPTFINKEVKRLTDNQVFINKESVISNRFLSQEEIGIVLLKKFIDEHDIYSLKKGQREKGRAVYAFAREKVSLPVVKKFFALFAEMFSL